MVFDHFYHSHNLKFLLHVGCRLFSTAKAKYTNIYGSAKMFDIFIENLSNRPRKRKTKNQSRYRNVKCLLASSFKNEINCNYAYRNCEFPIHTLTIPFRNRLIVFLFGKKDQLAVRFISYNLKIWPT